MNITFLIGNGFDLNIGLKTTYASFLKSYAVASETDNDLLKYFKNSILKDAGMWSNAEMAFGAATKIFKACGYTAEDFCICHEDFCIKLAEYLLNEEKRINYSLLDEMISTEFAKSILNYKNGFREAEREAIKTAERTFSGEFTFNFINFNYTTVLDSCFAAVHSKSDLLGKRSIGDRILPNRIGKVLHIHGTAHKDIVLGVNDISQIMDPSLFEGLEEEYINEIIKQKTNEINEENTDKKTFELLKSSDLIYIYGMSIGDTDKLWWERICTLMMQKRNLHLIIHKYDAPEDGLIRRSFRLFANTVRKNFTIFSDLEEDKKKDVETRIHIDRTNIFGGLNMLVDSPMNLPKKEVLITT